MDAGSVPTAEATEGSDEPEETEATPEEPADTPEPADDLPPPTSVTGPIGVVYQASGSFNETFGLIQTAEVSVFSTDEMTSYVDSDSITVCPAGEACIRTPRAAIEAMGLLGGQIVTDMSAFAASVAFSSATSETIAGRDARCIVPYDVTELQEYCYDVVSGIALRWQVIDEGVATTVTAIEVFEPTPADLSPSGPVEDREVPELPDLGDLDLGDLDLGELGLEGLFGS